MVAVLIATLHAPNSLFMNSIMESSPMSIQVKNKYSENAKACRALVSMYINEFRGVEN